jgi:hypothetical protein
MAILLGCLSAAIGLLKTGTCSDVHPPTVRKKQQNHNDRKATLDDGEEEKFFESIAGQPFE